jgi:hypothetical protein
MFVPSFEHQNVEEAASKGDDDMVSDSVHEVDMLGELVTATLS